jgi:hypothetical protein
MKALPRMDILVKNKIFTSDVSLGQKESFTSDGSLG